MDILGPLLSIPVAVATTWLTLWLVDRREQERRALRAYAAELQALTTLLPVLRQEQLWRPMSPAALEGTSADARTVELAKRMEEKRPGFLSRRMYAQILGLVRSQVEAELGLLIEARRSNHYIRDTDLRSLLVGIELGVRNVATSLGQMSIAPPDDLDEIDQKDFAHLAAGVVEGHVANIGRLFRDLEDACWRARDVIAKKLRGPPPPRPQEPAVDPAPPATS